MHHIFAPHPGLQREHCQDRQRGQADSLIAQRRPRQNAKPKRTANAASAIVDAPDSFRSLVHREGFEPSYLRGGADLQSAGFNHSPTCAELQNSSALPAHPAFLADIHADGRSCRRTLRTSEEQKCARVCYRTQTPHLENSLMECRWKICKPPRRSISCVQNQCWSWRRDLNP